MLRVVILLLLGCSVFNVISKKVKDHCQADCSNKNKTVCGSDDKEYTSPCHLKKSSCLLKNNVTVRYRGSCDCPKSCSKDYAPVCIRSGTSEKTYRNMCRFRLEKCKLQNDLEFVKKGPCKRWHRRACPESCVDIWAPVCGTDGETYSSCCALKMANCKSETRIGLKKIGYCRKACPNFCPEHYLPTCCTNGEVFANECEMRLAGCRLAKTKDYKRAKDTTICEGKCVKVCPKSEKPVCGSNGQTYLSLCELERLNCVHKQNIVVNHEGSCEETSSNNESPQIDTPNFILPDTSTTV